MTRYSLRREPLAGRAADQQVMVITGANVAREKDVERAKEYRVKLRVVA
jgi:hypothetical protein